MFRRVSRASADFLFLERMVANDGITLKQAAGQLGIPQSTARLWRKRGLFPNAKLKETLRGPVWMVPNSDVANLKRPVMGRPRQSPSPSRGPRFQQGQHIVYLISDGEFGKVGITSDLSRRLSQLQHASARRLTVLRSFESVIAPELEKTMHALLSRQHQRGEWYTVTGEQWDALLPAANELTLRRLEYDIGTGLQYKRRAEWQ